VDLFQRSLNPAVGLVDLKALRKPVDVIKGAQCFETPGLSTEFLGFLRIGYPLAVRTDNVPEFTSRAFMAWASSHGIRHILIEPGRLMQNGYIESFNGKFRDECLNEQWFETLHQSRLAIST